MHPLDGNLGHHLVGACGCPVKLSPQGCRHAVAPRRPRGLLPGAASWRWMETESVQHVPASLARAQLPDARSERRGADGRPCVYGVGRHLASLCGAEASLKGKSKKPACLNPRRCINCQTGAERLGRRRAAAGGRQRVAELSPLAQAMPAGPARGPDTLATSGDTSATHRRHIGDTW